MAATCGNGYVFDKLLKKKKKKTGGTTIGWAAALMPTVNQTKQYRLAVGLCFPTV